MARKPRHLSAEEEALWSSVAATANPLSKPKRRTAEPKPAKSDPARPSKQPIPNFRVGQSAGQAPAPRIDFSPDIADRVAAAPLSMDRRAFRKLSRGRMRPERRIDLHGMTLAQAHPALVGFILSSHAAGHRLVLVITGKGRGSRDTGGPVPERKGILREQVPRWLSTPPCKNAVLQVAQAHSSHGGQGAWYVYLRRSRD